MPTREEMHSLGKSIIHSYEARVVGIAALRKDVAMQKQATNAELRELNRAHKAMARQERADLARGRKRLYQEVITQLKELDRAHQVMSRLQRTDLARGQADLTQGVATQLGGFRIAHQTMARQKQADLARGRRDLAQSDARRKYEVNSWVNVIGAIRSECHDEWQKISHTLSNKRGTKVAEARPAMARPVQRLAPAPPPEEIAEEEAVSRAGMVEVTPEIAALSNKVFGFLADHPDGARLVELEQEFTLGRLQAARVIRTLMDENHVEKRGLLYFAI